MKHFLIMLPLLVKINSDSQACPYVCDPLKSCPFIPAEIPKGGSPRLNGCALVLQGQCTCKNGLTTAMGVITSNNTARDIDYKIDQYFTTIPNNPATKIESLTGCGNQNVDCSCYDAKLAKFNQNAVNFDELQNYSSLDLGFNFLKPIGGSCISPATQDQWGFYVNKQGKSSDKEKVIIDFFGGGACFNSVNCFGPDPAVGSTIFTTNLYPSISEAAEIACGGDISIAVGTDCRGFINITRAGNPFQNYTHIFVPYCTGDVHLGNQQFDYQNCGQADCRRNHYGAINAKLVVDWVIREFPNVSQMVLFGDSAGGYGSVSWAPYVAAAYSALGKSPHIVVISDASVGSRVWGADSWGLEYGVIAQISSKSSAPALPCHSSQPSCPSKFLNFTPMWTAGVPFQPVSDVLYQVVTHGMKYIVQSLGLSARMAYLDFSYDCVQRTFALLSTLYQRGGASGTCSCWKCAPFCVGGNCALPVCGCDEQALRKSTIANLTTVLVPAFSSFRVYGTDHTMVRREVFYTLNDSWTGQPLTTFVAQLLQPTTSKPTMAKPTKKPTTSKPTKKPTTSKPTKPTKQPVSPG